MFQKVVLYFGKRNILLILFMTHSSTQNMRSAVISISPAVFHHSFSLLKTQYLQDQRIPNKLYLILRTNNTAHLIRGILEQAEHEQRSHQQCFFFSQNIGQFTLKKNYFHYLKEKILDQCIQKTFYLLLKTRALVISISPAVFHHSFCLKKIVYIGSKYLKNIFFRFENKKTLLTLFGAHTQHREHEQRGHQRHTCSVFVLADTLIRSP